MAEPGSWPVPSAKPILDLSFSSWRRIRDCSLRGAFAQDSATKDLERSGLAAAVGRARHALVEHVGARRAQGQDAPPGEWVRQAFQELLTTERSKLTAEWRPAEIPQVRRWPGVQLVTARLVKDLAGTGTMEWTDDVSMKGPVEAREAMSVHASGIAPRTLESGQSKTEIVLRDEGRRLWGRLDRLERRGDQYAVVDLKSGIGLDREYVAARHRAQMLFYAGLVESEFEVWPTLELYAISGLPVVVDYSPGEVEALRATVETDRLRFNREIAKNPALPIGDASVQRCLDCPFKVVCPSFAEHWSEIASEATSMTRTRLSLARGVVTRVDVGSAFSQAEIEQQAQYSAPPGRVIITGLPLGLEVPLGSMLAVSRVAAVNSDWVLRANWDSVIWVFGQPPKGD